MSFEICKRCSKMFNKDGKEYCPKCTEINKKDFELILNHMKAYPKATVLDIITETGVPLKSVDCFVAEGTVVYVEDKEQRPIEEIKINSYEGLRRARFHLRR